MNTKGTCKRLISSALFYSVGELRDMELQHCYTDWIYQCQMEGSVTPIKSADVPEGEGENIPLFGHRNDSDAIFRGQEEEHSEDQRMQRDHVMISKGLKRLGSVRKQDATDGDNGCRLPERREARVPGIANRKLLTHRISGPRGALRTTSDELRKGIHIPPREGEHLFQISWFSPFFQTMQLLLDPFHSVKIYRSSFLNIFRSQIQQFNEFSTILIIFDGNESSCAYVSFWLLECSLSGAAFGFSEIPSLKFSIKSIRASG